MAETVGSAEGADGPAAGGAAVGGCGLGAGSGVGCCFGFGLGVGLVWGVGAECGFGLDSGFDAGGEEGCWAVAGIVRDASSAVATVDDECVSARLPDRTTCAVAATTGRIRCAGRVLTAEPRAEDVVGRSTACGPCGVLVDDPVDGAAGAAGAGVDPAGPELG